MSRAALEADLRAYAARIGVPLPEAPADTALGTLGLGSVELFELIAEIEDRHGIVVPLNDVSPGSTVGELLDQLAALTEARS